LDYKKKISPNVIDEGWTLYNKMKDYTRMVRKTILSFGSIVGNYGNDIFRVFNKILIHIGP
jgi:hypothetical protein